MSEKEFDSVQYSLSKQNAIKYGQTNYKSMSFKKKNPDNSVVYTITFTDPKTNIDYPTDITLNAGVSSFIGTYNNKLLLETGKPTGITANEFALVNDTTTNQVFIATYNGSWNYIRVNNKVVIKKDATNTNICYKFDDEDDSKLKPICSLLDIKGEKGDKGDTGIHGSEVKNVTTDGKDIIFQLKNYDTNSFEEMRIINGIDIIKSGIVLGNYRGLYDASTGAIPSNNVLNGQWWKVRTAGILNGVILQIGAIIIANKDTTNASLENFDLFPLAQVDELVTENLYLLKAGNTNVNQSKNYLLNAGNDGNLSIQHFDDVTNEFKEVAKLGSSTYIQNSVVSENGGYYIEQINQDGTKYNMKVAGKATSNNGISIGDSNKSLYLLASDAYINSVNVDNANKVIQYNPYFSETKQISQYTLRLASTVASSIKTINIKTTTDIEDYHVQQVDVATGISKYQNKKRYDYDNGFNKDSKMAGDINFNSTEPFYLVKDVVYDITINFKNPVTVMGKTINGTFVPYLIVLVDELIQGRLLTDTQIDERIKRISSDKQLWLKGYSDTNNSVLINVDDNNKISFKQLTDATNGTMVEANISDMSVGNYSSLVSTLDTLKTGTKYIADYNITTPNYSVFTSGKAGNYWRMTNSATNITIGGVLKNVGIGDKLILTKDVTTVTDYSSFILEPAPLISPWIPNTLTQSGVSGTLPSSFAGDDKWMNSQNGWANLPIFTGVIGGIIPAQSNPTGKYMSDTGFQSLPIYQGSTNLANGIAGLQRSALTTEKDFASFGDGTYRAVGQLSATNTWTGTNNFQDTLLYIKNTTDPTKILKFDVSGNTTNVTGILKTSFTTAKTIIIPDKSGTLAVTTDLTKANVGLSNVTDNAQIKKITSSINNNIAIWDGTTGDLLKDSGKALPNGTVVGTNDAQTLTNKTISGSNNTLSNIPASAITNTAIVAGANTTQTINVGNAGFLGVTGTGDVGYKWTNNGYNYQMVCNVSGDIYMWASDLGWSSGVKLPRGSSSWVSASDKRLKHDIVNIDSALDKILQLRPVEYSMDGLEKRQVGLIAQEAEQHVPLLVVPPTTETEDESSSYYSMSYDRLAVYAIGAIQEQQKIINDLQGKINELKTKIG